jgi:hypothetical protein
MYLHDFDVCWEMPFRKTKERRQKEKLEAVILLWHKR